MIPKIRDTRGKPSITLTFVAMAWTVLIGKFAVAGFFDVPAMSGMDFGTAFGAIGAVWWGREHTEKRHVE